MVEALVIIAWRNDMGAYLFDSMPGGIEIDGQDLMNLYNLHRFRDTQANFQFIQTQDLRIASFYSGGYNNPYVGKPNYAVAAVLEPGENPDKFEKPLRKLCNNLLIHLDDSDFPSYFNSMFNLVKSDRMDEIKIDRRKVSGPAPKAIETTSTIGAKINKSEEKDIFDDLLATVSEEVPDDLKFDEDAFRASLNSGAVDDPFGGSSSGSSSDPFAASSSDPFSTSSSDSSDPFSGDPFAKLDKLQAPEVKPPKTSPKVQTSKLLSDLKRLEERLPSAPSEPTADNMIKYLEQKVGVFERMLSVVSKIAGQLQAKEAELDEKNEIIAKLLLLLS